MYVCVQSFDNLAKNKALSTEEKMGQAMKLAGTSITLTTITDICAFSAASLTAVSW